MGEVGSGGKGSYFSESVCNFLARVLPPEPRLYQEIRERGLNSINHESDDDLLEEDSNVEEHSAPATIVVKSYRPAQVTWSQLPEVGSRSPASHSATLSCPPILPVACQREPAAAAPAHSRQTTRGISSPGLWFSFSFSIPRCAPLLPVGLGRAGLRRWCGLVLMCRKDLDPLRRGADVSGLKVAVFSL